MIGKKLTVRDIINLKVAGEKIVVLTAYDASFGRLLDRSGVEVVLVGDSLGMVLLGYESTVPVTMDEMLHHCRAVKHGVERALLVGDMPFLSYQVDTREAIANAGRFLKEAGCDAVKVEGGLEICETVAAMVRAGIPVMGHIGLTPQTAGAFAIVLECIPDKLAGAITASIPIPTIGIGAGPQCDGQVLVINDLLGMFEKFVPSFVKRYADLAPQIAGGVAAFRDEVKSGAYPDAEHSFVMQGEVEDLLKQGKG